MLWHWRTKLPRMMTLWQWATIKYQKWISGLLGRPWQEGRMSMTKEKVWYTGPHTSALVCRIVEEIQLQPSYHNGMKDRKWAWINECILKILKGYTQIADQCGICSKHQEQGIIMEAQNIWNRRNFPKRGEKGSEEVTWWVIKLAVQT